MTCATGGMTRDHPGGVTAAPGARNNFPLVPSERYLFIAGGIGITPLLPMIRQACLLGADWRLVYGGRSRASMAFLSGPFPEFNTEYGRYGFLPMAK
jgi:ferredoxin-NADP reductase